MMPITRLWHIGDVVLGVMDYKKKPSKFELARLAFALIGLVGNVIIERDQLSKDIIEVGGVKWKRIP